MTDDDSSGSEADFFIPRIKIAAYKENPDMNKRLKEKRNNEFRFTDGTNPFKCEKIRFLIDEGISCPNFLPMNQEDAIPSKFAFKAAQIVPNVPISEFVRKEFFYDCFTKFSTSI